jgi:hypothetical protein
LAVSAQLIGGFDTRGCEGTGNERPNGMAVQTIGLPNEKTRKASTKAKRSKGVVQGEKKRASLQQSEVRDKIDTHEPDLVFKEEQRRWGPRLITPPVPKRWQSSNNNLCALAQENEARMHHARCLNDGRIWKRSSRWVVSCYLHDDGLQELWKVWREIRGRCTAAASQAQSGAGQSVLPAGREAAALQARRPQQICGMIHWWILAVRHAFGYSLARE